MFTHGEYIICKRIDLCILAWLFKKLASGFNILEIFETEEIKGLRPPCLEM